ncbi:MAG: hypothetical protein AB7P02_28815 [Alphaproteobacteria bacterium]
MTLRRLYNLARVGSSTTGTGTLTLGPAVAGRLTFAQAGVQNGDIVSYGIVDGLAMEVGWGVYASAGPTLSRNVIRSTNANNPIVLTGAAQVFICALAEDIQRPYIDPTDPQFGAMGDGATDDTAAIQAAVDAASPGDTIRFRKGYVFRHQRVSLSKPLVVEIDLGCDHKLVANVASGQCLFDVTTADGVYFDLKGRLLGDRANQAGGHHNLTAIRSDGYGTVVVNGNGRVGRISGFDGPGLWLRSADHFFAQGLHVSDTYADGIYFETYDKDVANWWVEGCFVDRRGEAESFNAGCIKMQSANRTRYTKTGLHILDNVCLMDDDQLNVPIEVWNYNAGRIVSFDSGGTTQIQVGDTLTGASSGATGFVLRVDLFSGTWAGGDAAGELTIYPLSGTIGAAENLNVGANGNVATTTANEFVTARNIDVFIRGNTVEGSKIGVSVTCGQNVFIEHNAVKRNNWIAYELAGCFGKARVVGNYAAHNPGTAGATSLSVDNQTLDGAEFTVGDNTFNHFVNGVMLKGGVKTAPTRAQVAGNTFVSDEAGATAVNGDGPSDAVVTSNTITLAGTASRGVAFGDGAIYAGEPYRSKGIVVGLNTITCAGDCITLAELKSFVCQGNVMESTSGTASNIACFDVVDGQIHGNVKVGASTFYIYVKAQGRNVSGVQVSGDGGVEVQTANGYTAEVEHTASMGRWAPWNPTHAAFMRHANDGAGNVTVLWRDALYQSEYANVEGVIPGLTASMMRLNGADPALLFKERYEQPDEGWVKLGRQTHAGSAHGEQLEWKTASQELTAVSGASVTATGLIPDGAVDPIVTTRVTAEPGGAVTGYTVGDGTDVDLWGAAVAKTVGTSTRPSDYTAQPPRVQIGAGNVVITPTGASFNGTGAIRVTVQYREHTAPTS